MQEAVRGAKTKLGTAFPQAVDGMPPRLPGESESQSGLTPEILAAIPEQACTLHRLLGARPNSGLFRHDRTNPLRLDVLVVDEASMIDLALLAKLVEALPPQARLILLGDKDQLASVEAGAVFGDICAGAEQGAMANSIALLHKSYRFGSTSGIGSLADAIRRGDAPATLNLLAAGEFANVAWRNNTLHSAPDAQLPLAQRLLDGYQDYFTALHERAEPSVLFELFGRFRVLCAHREGLAGVTGLNALVEDALRRSGRIPKHDVWYHGRPVMVARNDYPISLLNGDIGIAWGDGSDRRVYFQSADGGLRDFPPGRVPQHETVYAMPVHKSQGSEFDNVLLALPDEASPVTNRAMIYTAVTRAKRHIEIWSGQRVLEQSIQRGSTRSSGLKDKLCL